MIDVSGERSVAASAGKSSTLSTAGVEDAEQVTTDTISTRNLIEPIFMKTIYIGVITPLLFAYLGSYDVLAPLSGLSQRLVNVLSWIWPILPGQYEVVLKVSGPGHAASYGFMCVALWLWPVTCAVAYLWRHAKQRKKILPISPKEIGQFMVAFPFANSCVGF
jgi:hypothetical protein